MAALGGEGGGLSARPAVYADNVMQAFLYRHLLPAEDFIVSTSKGKVWFLAPDELDFTTPAETDSGERAVTMDAPLRLVPGGAAKVSIKLPPEYASRVKGVRFALERPPKGISIGATTISPDAVSFVLSVDAATKPNPKVDTLVLSVWKEATPKGGKKKGVKPKKRSWPLRYFLTVPFTIDKGARDAAEQAKEND